MRSRSLAVTRVLLLNHPKAAKIGHRNLWRRRRSGSFDSDRATVELVVRRVLGSNPGHHRNNRRVTSTSMVVVVVVVAPCVDFLITGTDYERTTTTTLSTYDNKREKRGKIHFLL